MTLDTLGAFPTYHDNVWQMLNSLVKSSMISYPLSGHTL